MNKIYAVYHVHDEGFFNSYDELDAIPIKDLVAIFPRIELAEGFIKKHSKPYIYEEGYGYNADLKCGELSLEEAVMYESLEEAEKSNFLNNIVIHYYEDIYPFIKEKTD